VVKDEVISLVRESFTQVKREEILVIRRRPRAKPVTVHIDKVKLYRQEPPKSWVPKSTEGVGEDNTVTASAGQTTSAGQMEPKTSLKRSQKPFAKALSVEVFDTDEASALIVRPK